MFGTEKLSGILLASLTELLISFFVNLKFLSQTIDFYSLQKLVEKSGEVGQCSDPKNCPGY